jgi:hypothetical protein
MNRKVCIGCGRQMPNRGPVESGWTISQLSARGLGIR